MKKIVIVAVVVAVALAGVAFYTGMLSDEPQAAGQSTQATGQAGATQGGGQGAGGGGQAARRRTSRVLAQQDR